MISPSVTHTLDEWLGNYGCRYYDTFFRLEYNGRPINLWSGAEWRTERGAKAAFNSSMRCNLTRGYNGPEMDREDADQQIKELWSSGAIKIVEYKKVKV